MKVASSLSSTAIMIVTALLAAASTALVGSAAGRSDPAPLFLLDPATLDPASVSLEASNALATPVALITDKPQPSPSGDPHDYVSYGRYWWPDPATSNGLPFIRRDGRHNREQMARGDRGKMGEFTTTVPALAAAWHLEHNTNCAVRAGEWLRAWFVTPATRMNPSLDYAQVRLGHDDNLGSNFGLIDTRGLVKIIDSIGVLKNSPALSDQDEAAIRQWFTDYLRWLLTSENGRLEREAPNNHGTWYLVQAIGIARFVGDDERARQLAREGYARIEHQFAADGSQPFEIVRTDGLSYSVFNLKAQFQLATLAAPLGVDLWNHAPTNGASLRRGLAYLLPFNSAPETWPHRQSKPLEPGFLQPLIDQGAEIWPGFGNSSTQSNSGIPAAGSMILPPSKLSGAEVHHYREGGPEPMCLYVFKPDGWNAADQRPALVFFFGGGWNRGTPERSASWARYATRLGMVGIAPDYRTRERFDTSPLECVADGRAAVRWLQEHADQLGIDAAKVVVGGSSAGGHVALWTAIGQTPPGSNAAEAPNAKPAALILVSAVSDTSTLSGYTPRRFGTNALALSPVHHVETDMPPVLAFHGDADHTVPYDQALTLRDTLMGNGSDCELVTVAGGDHGFTSQLPEWKDKSRNHVVEFLTRQGILPVQAGH